MQEELQQQIQQLKHQVHNETDVDEKIELTKKLYKKKLELLDTIHLSEKKNSKTARQLIEEVKNKPKVPRYATGIPAIDEKLKEGIEIGTLLNFAGESFTGKTTLALEILANVSEGSPTVLFNFEMGETRISQKLTHLLTTSNQLDNFIIDSESRNLTDLIMEIELHAHNKVKFFAIDSKMKIEVSGNEDEYLKISMITKELSKLCQKLDIIIILINQLSESDIKNGRLSFKGSGDQQYDSDISWFYTKDPKTSKRKLICNKNRQDDYEYFICLDHINGRTVESEEVNQSRVVSHRVAPFERNVNEPVVTSFDMPMAV